MGRSVLASRELDKHSGPQPENYLLDKRDEEDEGNDSPLLADSRFGGHTQKSSGKRGFDLVGDVGGLRDVGLLLRLARLDVEDHVGGDREHMLARPGLVTRAAGVRHRKPVSVLVRSPLSHAGNAWPLS